MANSVMEGDITFKNNVSFGGSMYPPLQSINDDHVSSNANKRLASTKLIVQRSLDWEAADPASAVTAKTHLLHIVHGATAVIDSIEAAITTVATGADRTVNVDLQKSTAGGAFATVLSATILFNNVSTIRVPVTGAISSANLVDGDILQIVITVAGAASAQALGLLVTVNVSEHPA